MFHGQFGKVSNWPKTIILSIHCSCLKVKFQMIQKLMPSEGITQTMHYYYSPSFGDIGLMNLVYVYSIF